MPATLNQTLRWHYMKRHRYNEGWYIRLLSAAGKAHYEPKGKMVLIIEMHRSRFQDKDNMYGSVKPIVDALNKLGWMIDDDRKHLELSVRETKSKRKDQRTEIFLEGEFKEE